MAKRSLEEQRAINAQRQKDFRARQKAQRENGTPKTSGTVASSGETLAVPDEGIEVDVIEETQPQEEKLSLFQRTMAKLQGGASEVEPVKARARASGKKKQADENLLVTALPTLLASLVCTYSSSLLPDEYKECSPTLTEVSGIIAPLMEVIGRRVEFVGKVNQDATDIISSLMCALMMGTRMYITFVDIRKASNGNGSTRQRKAEPIRHENLDDGGNVPTDIKQGLRNYQATHQGVIADDTSNDGRGTYANDAKNDVERNGADASNDTGQDELSEAERVANLFRRDKQGRQQLGLLPSAV